MHRVKSSIRLLAAAGLLGLSVRQAQAVDGVLLIDQNRALAGSVTPGDAPGFPVTITRGGSYRLSSNLTVPNADTTAIEIVTNQPLTIDFNGFAILGPNSCSGSVLGCTQDGEGRGVATGGLNSNGVKIYGGSIKGMGGTGILLVGFGNIVRDMTVRENAGGGIQASGIISKNVVERNGSFGISTFQAVIEENFVSDNEGVGIFAFRGTVSDNHSERNGSFGFRSLNAASNDPSVAIPNAGFKGNFFADNNSAGVQVSGGTPLGPNICGTGVCP